MEAFGFVLVVVLFIFLAFGIWAISMAMDKGRITDYIRRHGGRVVSISWAPFGRGWFGEKEERIYEVVYYDNEGNQHFATAKTSIWTGVYWTEDRVTHRKARWYGALPPSNEAGNPLIRHIPATAEEERTARAAAEALGLPQPGAAVPESVDEEIARLRKRLAELEQKKREMENRGRS